MKFKKSIILIIAAILIIVGVVLSAVFDFGGAVFEDTTEVDTTEDFIDVTYETEDTSFVYIPSTGLYAK